ncbi:alpha/beta hydrolase [Flavobacterium zepuense]|uniref:Alpha/beta hydrolase n=1 Tax=Flavobacterium zepuense TaxID=2593302 RepID=A0A552UWB2_9FLAO|nr:alpha/beta hydrolase [Flavobacterium zepuense]TRW22531.1 alpha/beta hydrolase [Flavobacterium zepuense]
MKTSTDFTALTVPTQFADVNGTAFAYRRFGKKQNLPLVLLQHFTGTLENWDPYVLDGISKNREVIIFDNRGVAGTGGETPDSIAAIAKDAIAFIDALGLEKIDLLGFSMGGMVAQQITLNRPELINRLILVGTAPSGVRDIETFSPEVWAMFEKEYNQPDELLLETLFTPSAASQKAGSQFLNRIRERVVDRDSNITDKVAPAQATAIAGWSQINRGNFDYLKLIKQPTLVVSGDSDIIFPTVNSVLLQQNLPNAHLIIYPDSNHGALYQYPNLFISQVSLFLEGVE